MRTIPAAIQTAERAREANAITKMRVEKHHLSFASFASTSSGQVRTDLPLTMTHHAAGAGAYVAYRSLSGGLYVRSIDTANPADYVYPISAVTSIANSVCVRPGLFTDSFNVAKIFDVIASGAGFQVRSSSLIGATDPVALNWQNYGPGGWGGGKNTIDAVVTGFTDTATLIRRVEAVCPCEGGVIVAVGTHSITDNRSTVRFFWVAPGVVVALNSMIQCPFLEGYNGWQFASPHTTYIAVAYTPAIRKISVIATDTIDGHAITFTLQNGIESEVRPLVYVSAESNNIKLIPYNVTTINGLFYLTAGWTRRANIGGGRVITSEFDCYLTSSDGVLWSLGELSFFICLGHKHGGLIARRDALDTVYYVGIGSGYSSPASRAVSPNAVMTTPLDDTLLGWSASFGTNTANSIDVEVVSTPGIEANANLAESSIAFLDAGYNGVTTPLGVYGIDSAATDASADGGHAPFKIKGRDLASWKLIEYAAPIAFDMPSRVVVNVAINGWKALKQMTPDTGVTYTGGGQLIYKGLNDPYIALSETNETGDVLIKTRVKIIGTSTMCLGSIGFVFGMSESGQGNILMVPRQTTWSTGKIPLGPSMRKLVLKPINVNNPGKPGTGWTLSARVNPLWHSETLVEPLTLSMSGTWRVIKNFYMTTDKTYDLAFILKGRRAQLYVKEFNNTVGSFSPAAVYTLIAEYLFDATQQRTQVGRDFAGLALCTDVFVNADTFAGAVEPDLEAGITNAAEITSSLQSYDNWAFVDCGAVKAPLEAGAKTLINNPRAKKLARLIRGRAMICTADNTAVFMRRVKTDGLRHYLQEGAGASGFGFPGVNPVPVGGQNYGGSDPQSWRIILHHGFLFSGGADVFGLPATGDMIVDSEVVGYAPATLKRRGGVDTGSQDWTEIPTWYWVLEAAPENVTRLAMWWNGSTQVGDDTGGVAMVGMLAEILSQNGKTSNDKQQFYVTGHTEVTTPAAGATDSVDILPVYEAEIRNISAGAGDIACFSWRGKYQTIKTTHAPDAPVCFFPWDANTLNDPVSMTVQKYQSYSGPYQCTEDLIKKVCALAGMREANFKTRANIDIPITFNNTSRQQLPLIQGLASFCLDASIWIAGNGANGAGVAGINGTNRFEVYFRNHYILSIQSYATAEDFASGCAGVLQVGLRLRSGEIANDGAGNAWLEVASIPITDYGIGGTNSGGGTVWPHVADSTRRVDFRLSVQNNLIGVELGGSPVWTFNLDDYVTSGFTALRFDEPAAIEIAYTVAPTAYTTTFFVRELGEEVERFTVANGAAASSAISAIAAQMKLQWRPTATGGMLFTRFETRQDIGSVTENLWSESASREGLVQRTHRLVKGNASGEALDVAEIAAHGYRYGVANSGAVASVEQATLEATLMMRQEAEQSLTTVIDAIGLLEIEPEDSLTLVYANAIAPDAPRHVSSRHVVNSLSLRGSVPGAPVIDGTYNLRRLIGGE